MIAESPHRLAGRGPVSGSLPGPGNRSSASRLADPQQLRHGLPDKPRDGLGLDLIPCQPRTPRAVQRGHIPRTNSRQTITRPDRRLRQSGLWLHLP